MLHAHRTGTCMPTAPASQCVRVRSLVVGETYNFGSQKRANKILQFDKSLIDNISPALVLHGALLDFDTDRW